MSPSRTEHEQDCGDPPAAPGRQAMATRTTAVTGPAEVEAQLELHLSQCRRRGGVLALLCVSVEAVASPRGEISAGMQRLVRREVSHRIGYAVRGSDAILRESDRDTCVVMPGADARTAERMALRLRRLLDGDYRVAGELLQVVVRVGAAAHPEHGLRAQELMRRAGARATE